MQFINCIVFDLSKCTFTFRILQMAIFRIFHEFFMNYSRLRILNKCLRIFKILFLEHMTHKNVQNSSSYPFVFYFSLHIFKMIHQFGKRQEMTDFKSAKLNIAE